MLLSIQEMEVRKISFDAVFEPGKLDFSEAGVRQVTPLRASGEAEILEGSGGEVRVQARISVTMESDCDRCLARAEYVIDSPIDLFYQPAATVADENEIAIAAGEAEIGFYELPGIELEDLLREQVLLALPMQRVCREDCLGICPICGKNRNEVVCDCSAVAADDRWNGLKDLKL